MEEDLLLQIAHLYYGLELTQDEIAKHLFFSRTRVSQLLTEAKEKGYVRFEIRHSFSRSTQLVEEVSRRFHVSEAILVEDGAMNGQEVFSTICRVAGDYLGGLLDDHTVLNIGRGRTMLGVVQNLHPMQPLPGMKVIQTEGLLEIGDPYLEQTDIVRSVGELYQCQYHCVMLPFLTASQEIRDALLSQGKARDTMKLAEKVDTVCTSIMSLQQWRRYLTGDEYQSLEEAGAVGSAQGCFFDIAGNFIDTPLYRRFIRPDADLFFGLRHLICVTTGTYKAQALCGFLRSGLVDVLITSSELAQKAIGLAGGAEGGS